MPIYKTEDTLTSQAWSDLLRSREDRPSVINEALEKLGGRLIHGFGYLTGEYHGCMIYEVPDRFAAEAFLITITAPGHHGKTRTVELLDVDELDQAIRLAESIGYRSP